MSKSGAIHSLLFTPFRCDAEWSSTFRVDSVRVDGLLSPLALIARSDSCASLRLLLNDVYLDAAPDAAAMAIREALDLCLRDGALEGACFLFELLDASPPMFERVAFALAGNTEFVYPSLPHAYWASVHKGSRELQSFNPRVMEATTYMDERGLDLMLHSLSNTHANFHSAVAFTDKMLCVIFGAPFAKSPFCASFIDVCSIRKELSSYHPYVHPRHIHLMVTLGLYGTLDFIFSHTVYFPGIRPCVWHLEFFARVVSSSATTTSSRPLLHQLMFTPVACGTICTAITEAKADLAPWVSSGWMFDLLLDVSHPVVVKKLPGSTKLRFPFLSFMRRIARSDVTTLPSRDPKGYSALHIAVITRRPKVVGLIVSTREKLVDLNVTDSMG
jgi:hypothetical protein